MGNKPASSNVRCGRGPVHPKRKFLMVGCPCSFLDFLFRPMCPSPPDMPTKNKETKIKKYIRSMRSLYSPYSPYSHLSSAPNFCFLSSFLLFCFLFFFFSFCISPYLPLSLTWPLKSVIFCGGTPFTRPSIISARWERMSRCKTELTFCDTCPNMDVMGVSDVISAD